MRWAAVQTQKPICEMTPFKNRIGYGVASYLYRTVPHRQSVTCSPGLHSALTCTSAGNQLLRASLWLQPLQLYRPNTPVMSNSAAAGGRRQTDAPAQ